MDISVVHPTLNAVGGSEQVALAVLESLHEKGHKVTLGTFERTDWQKLEKYLGNFPKPEREVVCPRRFKPFAYGERFNFRALTSRMPKDSSAMFVSCTSPWFYPPKTQLPIIYSLPLLGYNRGFRRFYVAPYFAAQRRLLKKRENTVLLTNSLFSAKIINASYSMCPQVLYPPVNTQMFYSAQKENLVVSVGRFDPTKRHEILIEAFKKIGASAQCIIMGSVAGDMTQKSLAYIAQLKRLIRDSDLTERVKLLVNCPYDLLLKTLSKAKIYVHCFNSEPFGISVVESMASGCVPVVHRSGGAYEDIVKNDEYGFSFETTRELRNKLRLLLKDESLCRDFSNKAIARSKDFSKEKFKQGIAELVE